LDISEASSKDSEGNWSKKKCTIRQIEDADGNIIGVDCECPTNNPISAIEVMIIYYVI